MSDLYTADDDLAAEIDDDDNDPAADDAGADPVERLHYFAGIVESGPPPYPGRLLVSRFPAGVLLVDKPAARAYVLDFDPAGGIYRCRDTAGAVLDTAGRWRAAESDGWEVRAFDPDFAGDDPPGTGDGQGDDGGADYVQVPA